MKNEIILKNDTNLVAELMPHITTTGITVKVNSELMRLASRLSIHILWENNLAIIRSVKAEKDRQTRLPVGEPLDIDILVLPYILVLRGSK